MSYATLILGESGTGKSTSLRNLDPSKTLLIQAVKKPLPFRSKAWQPLTKDNPTGSIFVCDDANKINDILKRSTREVIVIDDFQYIMSNEFMNRSDEKGYEKFTDIGKHAWTIMRTASNLDENKRVYILTHTESNDFGKVKMKTIGKMLDEKVTPEGLFAISMRTSVINGNFMFSTKNNGNDTVKTPLEMFDSDYVENDLAMVDKTICDFYEINQEATTQGA